MDKKQSEYIPALKYGWMTSLYDTFLPWVMRESICKRRLVEQARIENDHRVLDLGCGTGTLTLLIKQAPPQSEVIGLDGDAKVLGIAKAKVARSGLGVTLDHGMAFDLPYDDGSFDCVLSSLLFHHLTREKKIRTLSDVMRVLRPGGELHVADWGRPQTWLMRTAFLSVQMLDGFETTADNVNGLLPELFADAGFDDVQQSTHYTTMVGTLAIYRASKPGARQVPRGR